jgi:hypothetical protein
MATWGSPDAIRVTGVALVRTVGPCGNEMLWIPREPKPVNGSPVQLYPEPVSPLEQVLLSYLSMIGIGGIAWYLVRHITGW